MKPLIFSKLHPGGHHQQEKQLQDHVKHLVLQDHGSIGGGNLFSNFCRVHEHTKHT